MSAALPTTIPDYLAQLRAALADNDPALVQDALFDAEEYLRGELAEHPHESEAAVIARVAGSYGAPVEVAEIYRDTESRVVQALRTPPATLQPRGALGRFFGVAADPRTWGALFYMVLALATGIVYFTLAVTGVSLSLGLMILIVGVPFALLFLGLTRVLSLVEGRLVEVMLGERMPRRPLYSNRALPLRERIGGMLGDPRTWSTLLYMVLMLPLGILYFTLSVSALATSLGLFAGGLMQALHGLGIEFASEGVINYYFPAWTGPFFTLAGVALLFGFLHLARGLGRLHGALAKQLLVKSAADA
jgi:uncharacterized membrane protein